MKAIRKRTPLQKYITLTTSLATGILFSLIFPNETIAESTSSERILYEVQPGDTLFSSAYSFGKGVREVADSNGLANPHVIHPGQLLVIEGSTNELAEVKDNLSPAGFIETVGDYAHHIAADHGLYASVMVAQAALESNYGKSTLAAPPAHNLFGIKGAQGDDTVVMSTTEFENGQWTSPDERFKKYPNYGASMSDNAQLLRNGNSWDANFYAGAWIENTENHQEATASLEGRYATDPTYDTKLDNIIEEHDLTRFDSEEAKEAASEIEPPSTIPASETTTHQVVAGDTLYNISNRYGMTVAELQGLNGLTSHAIKQGETLQVKATGQASQNLSTRTVAAEETLYNISNQYGMTVSELRDLNGLHSNTIKQGQSLQVKDNGETSQMETGTTHTVAAGDTLYNIANRYETTVSELQQLNQLSSNQIELGQTLKIGGAVANSATHTVSLGDTLYNIANRYGVTEEELKAKNNLTSNDIQLGQELQL